VFNTENSWHGSVGGSGHGSLNGSSRHVPEHAHGGGLFNPSGGDNSDGRPHGDDAPAGARDAEGGVREGPAALGRVFTLPREDASAVCAGDSGFRATSYTSSAAGTTAANQAAHTVSSLPGGNLGAAGRPGGGALLRGEAGPQRKITPNGAAATRVVRSASATLERDSSAPQSYARPQAGGGSAIGNAAVLRDICGTTPDDAESMLQQASELMDASEHGPNRRGGYHSAI
jgi:hypothetical protein